MNLDELQSIRDRERQSDSLQQLRETFYQEVGDLVQELRAEREAVAARADDPFDAPEVNRLTDDIKTAEQTVEAIYERRVGKLVKMASFAAADMPTEDEGLTVEERELFEHLVDAIEHNRDHVLGVLDGESDDGGAVPDALPGGASTAEAPTETPAEPAPESTPEDTASSTGSGQTPPAEPEGVDAADLMAGEPDAVDVGETPAPKQEDDPAPSEFEGDTGPVDTEGTHRAPTAGGESHPPETEPDSPPSPADTRSATTETDPPGTDDSDEESESDLPTQSEVPGTDDPITIDRATVKVTQEVGEIVGLDNRSYDLSSEDVVMLPEENAESLVERDAAERLD